MACYGNCRLHPHQNNTNLDTIFLVSYLHPPLQCKDSTNSTKPRPTHIEKCTLWREAHCLHSAPPVKGIRDNHSQYQKANNNKYKRSKFIMDILLSGGLVAMTPCWSEEKPSSVSAQGCSVKSSFCHLLQCSLAMLRVHIMQVSKQEWVRACWQCQVAIVIYSVRHHLPVTQCSLHCLEMETIPKDWMNRVSH